MESGKLKAYIKKNDKEKDAILVKIFFKNVKDQWIV